MAWITEPCPFHPFTSCFSIIHSAFLFRHCLSMIHLRRSGQEGGAAGSNQEFERKVPNGGLNMKVAKSYLLAMFLVIVPAAAVAAVVQEPLAAGRIIAAAEKDTGWG
ncbi:hypothetical protein ACWC4E_27035 [Streptomyces sp. NPDC001273]|uniref:hypothetical protein n=1 Tax=unclassified Streptomyces TaxID=2593676 RepID=UPI0033F58D8E